MEGDAVTKVRDFLMKEFGLDEEELRIFITCDRMRTMRSINEGDFNVKFGMEQFVHGDIWRLGSYHFFLHRDGLGPWLESLNVYTTTA